MVTTDDTQSEIIYVDSNNLETRMNYDLIYIPYTI